MDPVVVSAQFAAYTWYSEGKDKTPETEAAANEFARTNWESFLPCAHKGLGRLLLRLARRGRATTLRKPRLRTALCHV